MFCPSCGAPVEPGEKFCHQCGTLLNGSTPPPPTPTPTAPSYANVKDFVLNCGVKKIQGQIKAAYILLYVCAGINLVVQLAAEMVPYDAIIMAALAVWLQKTYSKTAALIALIYSIISVIASIVMFGTFSGWLILIAGIYAFIGANTAQNAYQTYLQTGVLPNSN